MAQKKRSNNYWKNRFLEIEKASNRYGQDAFREIEPAFDVAQRQIQREIEKWYYRFAKNNQITIEEAKKMLSAKELKEFHWDVNEYIKYGQENAINQQWVKELENASARVHVSRLEALKLRTQQAVEVAFGNELDVIDDMARRVYTEDYYRSIFEMQKGFNIGWDIGTIDQKKLDKLIVKPWTADNKTFKDRIWTTKNQMISELHQQLTRTCVLGKAPDEAIESLIKYVDKDIDNKKYVAGRLVMTEQAYFHSVAQKDAFNDLDVEEFEIVATLDSHTSTICQDMDGKHLPMSQYEPGVTAPPFHVFCRTVTVPYFEDNFGGERAARDEDGNTYYVPDDMTYKDWKNKFVDGNVVVTETSRISKKDVENSFSVDRNLVNSKEFHDKFEGLTEHKSVNESIYQETMKMLEHRDGTDFEDLIAIDAKTGKVIVANTLSTQKGKTAFTKDQYEEFIKHSGESILLHNHPNGSRLSFTDIRTLFKNKSVIGSVAIGHDGSLHYISKINSELDIDKVWEKVYNDVAEVVSNKTLAEHYALDILYDMNIFIYKRR